MYMSFYTLEFPNSLASKMTKNRILKEIYLVVTYVAISILYMRTIYQSIYGCS